MLSYLEAEHGASAYQVLCDPEEVLQDMPLSPMSSARVAWRAVVGRCVIHGQKPLVWSQVDLPALATDAGGYRPFHAVAIVNALRQATTAKFTGSIGAAELEAI